MRLWRFVEGDVVPGNTYIIRGLRIMHENYYDNTIGKYAPRPGGRHVLLCGPRTAVEDVTHVTSITEFFDA